MIALEEWLRADTERCSLVEFEWHDGTSVRTERASTHGFQSQPTDSVPNRGYDDRLVAVPEFRRSCTEPFTGRSSVPTSQVTLASPDGHYRALLRGDVKGRPIRYLVGDPRWPRDAFFQVISGTIRAISARDDGSIDLEIADRQALLDVPVLTARFPTGSANEGKPIPRRWGRLRNVAAILEDAPTHRYRLSVGQIAAVSAVYENARLVSPSQYTVDLVAATLTFTASPSGTITVDMDGEVASGVWLSSGGAIAERIILTLTKATSADLAAPLWSAFKALCPQIQSLSVEDESTKVTDAVDALVTSVGGFTTTLRSGEIYPRRFDAPDAANAVLVLDDDNIAASGLRIERRIEPRKSWSLGYRRRWLVQQVAKDSVDVTEAVRAEVAEQYSVAPADAPAGVLAQFPSAEAQDMRGTCLYESAAALAEAARELAVYAQARLVVRVPASLAALTLNVGDTVLFGELEFDDYDLTGRPGIVIDHADRVDDDACELLVLV